ncbi:MAG: FAD-binding protein [Gemmatimonadetes bacterium]|nr:FAD-binding protein [Gemmatimonadota bacterium]NIU29925.1 FAD-binding protein [Gemmatimonadota bacterium]NIU34906.1 FAD-binding protein [Gemmatimonadota bacterium]NIW62993.1 FAD-binding protein [Gemmatimonadota bacterium]
MVETVLSARRSGSRLRAAGSGGSKSAVSTPPDVALRLEQPDRLVSVEGDRVTAPAGMTGGRLQELLAPEGLVLPTVGEWKNATLAGALATGTHGGSARWGIMATSVESFRIVNGRGEAVEVSRGEPDHAHLAVSLGAFGVVTRVSLACVERFSLRLDTDVVPFEEYLRDPVAQESRTEFHASIWVPWARKVIRFAAQRAPDPGPSTPRRERFGRRTELATLVVRRLGLPGAVSSRFFQHTAVGDSAEILSPLEVPGKVARFRAWANEIRGNSAAELAVDAGRAAEILTRFDAFFRERSGPLNNPIGLRMSAADAFSLSPCSGRDTLWLDIFYDDAEPFTRALADLGEEVGARCHWGKALALRPRHLRGQYPGWDAYAEARRRFDPDEVFANGFTDELGLTGEPHGTSRG